MNTSNQGSKKTYKFAGEVLAGILLVFGSLGIWRFPRACLGSLIAEFKLKRPIVTQATVIDKVQMENFPTGFSYYVTYWFSR